MILSRFAGNRVLSPGTDIRFPQRPLGLRGMGDTNSGDWFSDAPQWIKELQVAYNTQRLLDLNVERAKAGLPPITSSSVAPTLNFGLSPQTMQMVMVGAAILLVAVLLKRRS